MNQDISGRNSSVVCDAFAPRVQSIELDERPVPVPDGVASESEVSARADQPLEPGLANADSSHQPQGFSGRTHEPEIERGGASSVCVNRRSQIGQVEGDHVEHVPSVPTSASSHCYGSDGPRSNRRPDFWTRHDLSSCLLRGMRGGCSQRPPRTLSPIVLPPAQGGGGRGGGAGVASLGEERDGNAT